MTNTQRPTVSRATGLLAIALGLFGGIAAAEEAPTLTVAASNWAPYVDSRVNSKGAIVMLIRTALERAGYSVDVVFEPWPASLEKVKAGTHDVLAGAWYTDERNETLAFSRPILENDILFMKRADDIFVWYGRESLEGKRIGVVEDYAYSDKRYDTTGLAIVRASSVRENVKRLLDGELDLVLGDYMVMRHEADQLVASSKLDMVPRLIERRELKLAVSRKNPDHEEIVAAFDRAIAQMKEDRTYSSILASHRISY